MANDNPFQDPLRFERQAPECAVVIFGMDRGLMMKIAVDGSAQLRDHLQDTGA